MNSGKTANRRMKAIYSSLLMQDDTPHRIAMGMAVGLFIAWTPTVGIQMLLVIPVAWLFRANRVAALIGVYASNPFTLLPMYWIEYKLGTVLLHDALTYEEFLEIVALHGWEEWWSILVAVSGELMIPMWIGGSILGAASGVLGYFATHWLVCRMRRTGRDTSSGDV